MNIYRVISLFCLFALSASLSAQEMYREYYEDGGLKYEYTVDKNNVPNGPAKWYRHDGKLTCEKNFENGYLNGISKWYHESGALHIRRTYKNGKAHGLEAQYSEDGALVSEQQWKNGVLEGESREYYNTRGILSISIYKNNELLDFTTFNPDGTIASNTAHRPDKSSVVTIYKDGKKISKAVYDTQNTLLLMLTYDSNGKLEDVSYRKIDFKPSDKELIDYLLKKDETLSYEKLTGLEHDDLLIETIAKIFLQSYEKKERFDNVDLEMIFEKGLLIELLNKVEVMPKNDPERSEYLAITRLLTDKIKTELNGIKVELIAVDWEVLLRQYDEEAQSIDEAVNEQVGLMGSEGTSEIIANTKSEILKFKAISEKAANDELTDSELVEFIDNGFLQAYLDKAKKIEDADKRYKRLAQIKCVVEDMYYGGKKLSSKQASCLKGMLQQVKDIEAAVQVSKVDRMALRKKIITYFKKPSANNADIGDIVTAAIVAFANQYYKDGTLPSEALLIIYDKGGIYDYLKEDPDRTLDLLLLSGLFLCINKETITALPDGEISSIVRDFDNYAKLHGLKMPDVSSQQEFKEFKREVQKLDSRTLKWKL
jgi:antitoxin component YwqK of YwqJK toxin-antitoxin module